MVKAPVKGAVAGGAARSVDDVLKVLPAGKQPNVRIMQNEKDLKLLFDELVKEGRLVSKPDYKGQFFKLPDGTTVGLREGSKSGGPTIDINVPGQQKPFKIHTEG